VIIGGKIKIFDSRRLPSNIIWPFLFSEANTYCKTLHNQLKDLKQSILWLEKVASGAHLIQLQNYFVDCCIMEGELQKLCKKVDLTTEMHKIVFYSNQYKIITFSFDKLIWKIADVLR